MPTDNTKELSELAPKKWKGHFHGAQPSIGEDEHLVQVGDLGIDEDAEPGKGFWRCVAIADSHPSWEREAVVTVAQLQRFESSVCRGVVVNGETATGSIRLGETPLPSGSLLKSIIVKVRESFGTGVSICFRVENSQGLLADQNMFDLEMEGIYENPVAARMGGSAFILADYVKGAGGGGLAEVSAIVEVLE